MGGISDMVMPVIDDLQKLLNLSPFAQAYRFEVLSAAGGNCTIRTPYTPQFDRPDGIVSGQVVMTTADVAMWLAIKTIRGIDDNSVTTHMETHFFQSARQEAIVCNAEVLKSGKRRSFGIARCTNEAGDLLTYHTLTYVAR
jgi:acyl-coenzyme A thioesterase PaaI-like protein